GGLYTLLIIDVLATYTRGFWIGSALAVSAVIILASSSLRRSLMIAAGSVAIMLALGVVGYGFRISLFDYVLDRAATTLDTGSGTPPASDIFGGAPQPSAVP